MDETAYLMPVHAQQCRIDAAREPARQMRTNGCVVCAAVLAYQHLYWHTFGRVQHGHLVLLNLLALRFVTAILEPDLNLCLRKPQHLGQLGTLRSGKVALLGKASLQLEDLGVAKGGSRALFAQSGVRWGGGVDVGSGGRETVVGVLLYMVMLTMFVVVLVVVVTMMMIVVVS